MNSDNIKFLQNILSISLNNLSFCLYIDFNTLVMLTRKWMLSWILQYNTFKKTYFYCLSRFGRVSLQSFRKMPKRDKRTIKFFWQKFNKGIKKLSWVRIRWKSWKKIRIGQWNLFSQGIDYVESMPGVLKSKKKIGLRCRSQQNPLKVAKVVHPV